MSAWQLFNMPRTALTGGLALKPSWRLRFFLTGTSTPTPVYQTSALDPGSVHTQPVVADSGGIMPEIYLNPSIVYRCRVYDENDVEVSGGAIDPCNDQNFSQAVVEVLRYGAVGDGVANDTDAIQNAIDAAGSSKGTVIFPPGIFNHTGLTLPEGVTLQGAGQKATFLNYTPATGNHIEVTGRGCRILGMTLTGNSWTPGWAIHADPDTVIADFYMDGYEIERAEKGVYLPYGLQVSIGQGRISGHGKAVAGGIGLQLGDLNHTTPRLVNTQSIGQCYVNGFETNYVLHGTETTWVGAIAENCINAIRIGTRFSGIGGWVQADTKLVIFEDSFPATFIDTVLYDGASVELDDLTSYVTLSGTATLGVIMGNAFKSVGNSMRLPLATSYARALTFGTGNGLPGLWNMSGRLRATADDVPFEVDRSASGARVLFVLRQLETAIGALGVDAAGLATLLSGDGSQTAAKWDAMGNLLAGAGALGTTSTNGFVYAPTCAGTPTGVPTAQTGYAPIVIDTTNNKLYFYSGGAWRDAGP